jgi:hypothetical protein
MPYNLRIGVEAVEKYGDVVVPVEEVERLFAQHDEHRVSQLPQLAALKHNKQQAIYR